MPMAWCCKIRLRPSLIFILSEVVVQPVCFHHFRAVYFAAVLSVTCGVRAESSATRKTNLRFIPDHPRRPEQRSSDKGFTPRNFHRYLHPFVESRARRCLGTSQSVGRSCFGRCWRICWPDGPSLCTASVRRTAARLSAASKRNPLTVSARVGLDHVGLQGIPNCHPASRFDRPRFE